LCIEFGRNNCFYIVCKFIYHTTFFEINNITLCAEPSFFIFYIFCVEFTFFVCWTPLPIWKAQLVQKGVHQTLDVFVVYFISQQVVQDYCEALEVLFAAFRFDLHQIQRLVCTIYSGLHFQTSVSFCFCFFHKSRIRKQIMLIFLFRRLEFIIWRFVLIVRMSSKLSSKSFNLERIQWSRRSFKHGKYRG